MSKGSKRRKEDFKKVQIRWAEIDWTDKPVIKFNLTTPNQKKKGVSLKVEL